MKPVGSRNSKMSAESRIDSVFWVKNLISKLIEGPGNESNTFVATLSTVVTFSNITAQIVAYF